MSRFFGAVILAVMVLSIVKMVLVLVAVIVAIVAGVLVLRGAADRGIALYHSRRN